MLEDLAESYKKSTNVEADVIRYLVWREIIGEEGWFEKGLKELACCVGRHEKSIGEAVKLLEAKGMIQKEKNDNKLWIKHTLTNDELYTRMAFIDPMFCNTESMHEFRSDLLNEIKRLEEEIITTKEANARNQGRETIIDAVLGEVTESNIDKLVTNFEELTYENSNKSHDECIMDALETFRDDVFSKHEETFEEEKSDEWIQETYELYWSRRKEEGNKEKVQ